MNAPSSPSPDPPAPNESDASPEPSGDDVEPAPESPPSGPPSAPATPSDEDAPATEQSPACANCGAALHGPYCAQCGQEAARRIGPFWTLVREAFDELLSLDLRLFRTLRRLPVPGALTTAYLGGRRAAFVPPLRLFVLAGLTLLLSAGLARQAGPVVAGEPAGRAIKIEMSASEMEDLERRIQTLRAENTVSARIRAAFLAGFAQAAQDEGRVNRMFFERLSLMGVLLLPVVALLLKGLYRRRLYAEHFVFALHVHALAFLVAAGSLLAGFGLFLLGVRPGLVASALSIGVVAAVVGYVLRALRVVYGKTHGESLWRTLIKGALLLGLYPLLSTGALALYTIGTLLSL